MTDTNTATMGHNRPPIITTEDLATTTATIDARMVQLLGAVGRAAVTDDTTAGKAADLVKLIIKAEKDVKAAKETAKRPILDAGGMVEDHFKPRLADLAAGKSKVLAMIGAFQRRLAAEEARERAEAERARVAEIERSAGPMLAPTIMHEPAPAVSAPIRGGTGAGVSTRKTWGFTVTDPAAVPRAYLVVDGPAIKAAIAAGIRSIPGVEISETETTVVR